MEEGSLKIVKKKVAGHQLIVTYDNDMQTICIQIETKDGRKFFGQHNKRTIDPQQKMYFGTMQNIFLHISDEIFNDKVITLNKGFGLNMEVLIHIGKKTQKKVFTLSTRQKQDKPSPINDQVLIELDELKKSIKETNSSITTLKQQFQQQIIKQNKFIKQLIDKIQSDRNSNTILFDKQRQMEKQIKKLKEKFDSQKTQGQTMNANLDKVYEKIGQTNQYIEKVRELMPKRIKMNLRSNNRFQYNQKFKTIKKITSNNNWNCLIGQQILPKTGRFTFSLIMYRSFNRGICLGIVTDKYLSEENNLWGKDQSVLYLANDGRVCVCGVGSDLGPPVQQPSQFKVQVDIEMRAIQWFKNNISLGIKDLSQIFIKKNTFILVQMLDSQDEIKLLQ